MQVSRFLTDLSFCRLLWDSLRNSMSEAFGSLSAPEVRYHGLINHGATCYLNSVLQVLFMTEDFRKAVKSHSNAEFIDHHLKDLFDDLEKHVSDTHEIIKALDIDTVNKQQDAAEYCQKILRLTSPEAAKIFHGELTNRRFCSSCRAETDTDESFWILPLSLVNSSSKVYSVKGGISEFFRTSFFTGQDQMYCEHCDTKVDACTRYVVKHHPEVLILLLKRFDFSFSYMTYVKINDSVDVPTSLNIPENQTYELYAVVDHVGNLTSGHYSSIIRSQVNDRWYEFNDTTVTPTTFKINIDDDGSKTAFLLFYRKKDTSLKVSLNKDDRPAVSDNYDQDPITKDKANNHNEEVDSEDKTLSVPSLPDHQKIHTSDNSDDDSGDEDMRRLLNSNVQVDGAVFPAGKKHQGDETLQEAKRSETKQNKLDVQVAELSEEIKRLQAHDKQQQCKIDALEKQVDNLEQNSNMNSVVIIGLRIKPRSKAAKGNNASNPGELDSNSVKQQVVNFLKSKRISLDVNNIETCYMLPWKRKPNKPVIIIRFRNEKHKLDLLMQRTKLKGTNVYMNDHLTKRKAEIARKARLFKKQKLIQDTWTRNCQVYVKLNVPPELAPVRVVNNMEDLEKCLCDQT